jgi:hypothetical protein
MHSACAVILVLHRLTVAWPGESHATAQRSNLFPFEPNQVCVKANSICMGAVQAFAHVVFGVSKDYCASGFRVGAVWTQNEALVKCAPSNATGRT